MARRRTTLTTRGVVALSIAPLSAVAGVLTGAEELVLLSLALLTLVATGLVQSAHRAALARGHWQVAAALSSSDVEVGSRATLPRYLGRRAYHRRTAVARGSTAQLDAGLAQLPG